MSNYTVHSVVVEPMPVQAKTENGREVTAMVPGVVVELIADGHEHGSMTRRYVPETDDELQELLRKYPRGGTITVTTEKAGDSPKADRSMRARAPGAAQPTHVPESAEA